MLKIADGILATDALTVLTALHNSVMAAGSYSDQVERAKKEWDAKTSTVAKDRAFRLIRSTLQKMCTGPVRCTYCEDSLADEIEHVLPKTIVPSAAFDWSNFLFACGPCNGPKNNQYGVIVAGAVVQVKRGRNDPILPPPDGPSAFINPRAEDPLTFFELDVGGTTQSGEAIAGTFDFLPAQGISLIDECRAEFTIETLGLNREVMRMARANAFGGYRARLREYAEKRAAGAEPKELSRIRQDLLGTPHLSVFIEMRRQRAFLPEIDAIIEAAPEIEAWAIELSQ